MPPDVDESPKPRGRPARSPAEAETIRAKIASCAYRLFRDEGYAAVSMRSLAREAGCTVMTLYRYYPRKIDILRSLWADVFRDLFDRLEQTAASHTQPRERLDAIALGYVTYWLDRREHYFLVFMSSGVTQADVSVFVEDDAILGRFALFRESLAAASPRIGEAELTLKTDLLLCTLNGIAHNLITISAYPWATPKDLVMSATTSLLSG